MKKILNVLCSLLIFCNCTGTDSLPTVELTWEKSIDQLADSILFANLKCLTMHNGNLFVSDVSQNHILCMDKDLKLISVIGKSGEGPSELLGINQFAINDSSIAVINGGNYRINIFKTDGVLLKEYSLINHVIYFHTLYRFGYNGTQLIGCSSLPDSPLTIYDISTGKQTFFGEGYKFHSPIQDAIRNGRFTSIFENSYVVVSDNMPFIEIYDKNTNQLTNKYDYSSINCVSKSLKAIENQKEQYENSYSNLCEDIYVDNENLYILVANFKDKYSVNEIIRFKLSPHILPAEVIKLLGDIYSTFCVTDTLLYAYNSSKNTLEKYTVSSVIKGSK